MMTTRRTVIAALACMAPLAWTRSAMAALDEQRRRLVDAAFAMQRKAAQSGDQPYGAVIVRDGAIVGWGPSRVVVDDNWNAHAERVALWDAQARLGRSDLPDCVIYSTSRPCSICEQALAVAGIARTYYGADAADAGRPRQN